MTRQWKQWGTVALASLAMCASVHAELVTNGGFEAGSALTGWTSTKAPPGESLVSVGGFGSHSGTQHAIFGAIGTLDDTISQTLSTVAGESYDISFWLLSQSTNNLINNHFSFNWDGGANELDLLNIAGATLYTQYTFTLAATSASTTISFSGRNRPTFLRLDDISVTESAVPEPGMLALAAVALLAAVSVPRRFRG